MEISKQKLIQKGKLLIKIGVFILFIGFYLYINREEDSDEEFAQLEDLLKKYNFPYTRNKFFTDSGYLVGFTRFQKKNSQIVEGKQPILLIHGLNCDENIWVRSQETYVLPYNLANEGFDVYIADLRGSKSNIFHLEKDESQKEFWDYGIDDLIQEDLVKIIEKVNELNKKKIIVVGHSLGGTLIVGAFAEKIKIVEENVGLVISLGAAFHLKDNKSFLPNFLFLANILNPLGYHYLATNLLYFQSKYLKFIFYPLARWSMDLEGSPLDETRISIVCSIFPAYSSMKIYQQLHQMWLTNKFQKFDYGENENLLKYQTKQPPEYKLNQINQGQFYFLTGINDQLSTLQDNQLAAQNIQKNNKNAIIIDSSNGHLSYIISKNQNNNQIILSIINNFLKNIQLTNALN